MITRECNTGATDAKHCPIASGLKRHTAGALRAYGVVLGLCTGAFVQAGETTAPQEKAQHKAGYSAGYAFGGQLAELQRQNPGIDLEAVFSGILDALSGAEPRLSSEEMRAAMQTLERKDAASPAGRGATPQMRAHARGGYVDDFAALNARREGVITLPSGVQYEVLSPGKGKRAGGSDAVLVNYEGALTNGAVFDSTYQDGEPARLQLAEIAVPGLKEALLLMNEGARWRVVIPPSMGFKNSGNNMLRRRDLIYEIELVSVEATAEPATTTGTDTTEDASTAPPDAAPATPGQKQP